VMSGVTQAQVGAGSTTGTTGSSLDYIPGQSTGGKSGAAVGSNSPKPMDDKVEEKVMSTQSVKESGKSNSKMKKSR